MFSFSFLYRQLKQNCILTYICLVVLLVGYFHLKVAVTTFHFMPNLFSKLIIECLKSEKNYRLKKEDTILKSKIMVKIRGKFLRIS